MYFGSVVWEFQGIFLLWLFGDAFLVFVVLVGGSVRMGIVMW